MKRSRRLLPWLLFILSLSAGHEVGAQSDAGVDGRTEAPIRRLRTRQIHPRRFALAGRDYLAAEAGDLDADGKAEIVLVRAGAVGVVRLPERGARVEAVASQALPPLAAPLLGRRLLAVARVEDSVAYLQLSSRPLALEFTLAHGELRLRETPPRCGAAGYVTGDACARLVEGRDYFASQLAASPGADPASSAPPRAAPSSFYRRRVRSFGQPDGARARVEALVNPSGRLLTTVGAHTASLLGVGAALALGDLEGDGEPELLTSVATAPDRPERLLLYRLRPRDGRLTRLYRSPPLEGRVMVAGAGDLDGDGDDEFFAVEEPAADGRARLWVLP